MDGGHFSQDEFRDVLPLLLGGGSGADDGGKAAAEAHLAATVYGYDPIDQLFDAIDFDHNGTLEFSELQDLLKLEPGSIRKKKRKE